MTFIGYIIERLNIASSYFYNLYLETLGWVYPFWLMAGWFYALSEIFSDLAWDFFGFSLWINEVTDRLAGILSYDNIWGYFQYYFEVGWSAWLWVEAAVDNVLTTVDTWWSSTQFTVQGWISAAQAVLQSQVDNVNSWLTNVQASVDDFISRIPTLDAVVAWWSDWTGEVLTFVNTWWTGKVLEVQGLINSAFIEREPFWSGWQDWRDQVTEFFTDPEDWAYKRLDGFFERFW